MENPLEGQPLVKLHHPELDSDTTQPLSYARTLVAESGWEPANDAAAKALGVSTKKARTTSRKQGADATTEKGD